MIVTKAVAAILMTSLGSMAAGTAAYFEANPRFMTHQPEPYVPPPPTPLHAAHVTRIQPLPREPESVSIEPVVITSRPHSAPKAAVKARSQSEGACSEWQDLATGPAGRKVRMLCPH